MKRELLTLGVTAVFALFLAGTSRVHHGGTSMPSEAAAPVTTAASLPDTSSWTTFTDATAKLTAKTPPGAVVECTARRTVTACAVTRRGRVFAFSKGGNTARRMADDLRKKVTPGSSILYDAGDTIVVHRSDPKLGEYCEMVASTAPGYTTISEYIPGMDPATFKTIAPQDQDCLDVVAFATTLETTP